MSEAILTKDARAILTSQGPQVLRDAVENVEVLEAAPIETYAPDITESQWQEMEMRVCFQTKTYKESIFARELNNLLPPILTTGDTWRVFDGSRWELIAGPARFLPLALRILARFHYDTACRARDLLSHIGAAAQTTQTWRGAYAFDTGGAVLLNLSNGILRVTRNSGSCPPKRRSS